MTVESQFACPDRLTEGQKDCLRLVMLHFSSKEIARKLGVSPHTVDKRLKTAISIMGVATRVDAARILANSEAITSEAMDAHQPAAPAQSAPFFFQNAGDQPLVYQRLDLSLSPDIGSIQSSPGEWNPAADKAGNMLRQHQMAFESHSGWQSNAGFLGLVSRGDNQVNDLTVPGRLIAMCAIVAGSILTFSLFVSVIEGLSRLY
jgi:DNA-binding CsgD family transcriptional regulator